MVCLLPLARIHVPEVRREVAKSRCGDAAVLFNDPEIIPPLLDREWRLNSLIPSGIRAM